MGADGLPGEPLHLIVARDVLNPAELKFFVSNAPAGASVQAMLLVAFSRWRVERCFEDQKCEIGLDQYEGRRYQGLKRHLILSCVSYLFLSRMRQEFGGGKPGADGVPGAHGGGGVDPVLVVEPEPAEEVAGADLRGDRAGAAPERRGAEEPHQADTAEATRDRASSSPNCPGADGTRLSAVILNHSHQYFTRLTTGYHQVSLWFRAALVGAVFDSAESVPDLVA